MARGRRRRTGPPGPVRTCVACRESAPRVELLRLVADEAGRVRLDLTGAAPGRGAWVHADHLARLDGRPGPLHRTLRRKQLDSGGLLDDARAALLAAVLQDLAACHRAGLCHSGAARAGRLAEPAAMVVAGAVPLPGRAPVEQRLPVDARALGAVLGKGPRSVVAVAAGRPTLRLVRRLRWMAPLG